ncbi:hypothetical protein CAMGR0001_1915 [Campylobacter gracilis RM3268]|uniref:Uncharacterized protein n=1 Tax=Campylobacter gracilis RM3268 TaxID=553220 RepID=C8PLA6_9BACT|nr:hypothetical protein CAMGR0001_1915 [Campylobacter gracilis RM3268]
MVPRHRSGKILILRRRRAESPDPATIKFGYRSAVSDKISLFHSRFI